MRCLEINWGEFRHARYSYSNNLVDTLSIASRIAARQREVNVIHSTLTRISIQNPRYCFEALFSFPLFVFSNNELNSVWRFCVPIVHIFYQQFGVWADLENYYTRHSQLINPCWVSTLETEDIIWTQDQIMSMSQTKIKEYLGREVGKKRNILCIIFDTILAIQAVG
jgi:hypothetical protein